MCLLPATDALLSTKLVEKYDTLQPIPPYLIPSSVRDVVSAMQSQLANDPADEPVTSVPVTSATSLALASVQRPAQARGSSLQQDQVRTSLPWSGHLGCAIRHSSGRTLLMLPSAAELKSRPPRGGVKYPQSGPDWIPGLGTALFRFQVDAHGMPLLTADGQLRKTEPLSPEVLASATEPHAKCAFPPCDEPARGPGGGPAAACSHAHFRQALEVGCPLYPNAQEFKKADNARLLQMGFLDLMGSQPASAIPAAAMQAVDLDEMHKFLTSRSEAKDPPPGDALFDTATAIPPTQRVVRVKTTAKSSVSAKQGEARRIVSLCQVARETGRPLSLDILRPNQAFWADFSEDTLSLSKPVASISKYSNTLNSLSSELAEVVGPSHPIHDELTSNQGKPWHAEQFMTIQNSYSSEVAARKTATANKVVAASGVGPQAEVQNMQAPGPVDAPKDSQALAMPTYLLDEIIRIGLEEMQNHEQLLARIAILENQGAQNGSSSRSTRKRKRTAHAPMPSVDKAHNPGQQFLNWDEAQQRLDQSEKAIGAAGICLLQFVYMARASTIAAAQEYNPQGSIAADVQVNDQGMTYVVNQGLAPS